MFPFSNTRRAEKRIKMRSVKREDQESETEIVDRLSELPDNVIHYILSFVPTVDAFRMSILSKRWRRIWYSLPVLSFSDSAAYGNSELCGFAGKCFTLRKNDILFITDTPITKFKLCTKYDWTTISCWLKSIGKSNLRELDLEIRWLYYCCFPPEALCSSSLTHIRLNGVKLGNLHSASLPSLKYLSLEYVIINDEAFHNLLAGSCVLEKLLVKDCYGLSNPKVSSLSLKFLDTDTCHGYYLDKFQLEAVNLESFVCCGSRTCSISTLLSCQKIKNLTFYGSMFKDRWLETLILRLPVLESLMIDNCKELRHINIRGQKLKHIILKIDASMCDESDVIIDSPNLVSFRFEGSPSLKILMNVENLLEANITLHAIRRWNSDPLTTYDSSWHTNVLDFLSKFNHANTIGMVVYSEKALIFPDELRKIRDAPLSTVKHFKVTTDSPLLRNADLQDSLFWALPSLETLWIGSRT